ncbi:choice-of-anchor J domain-containing protein [Chryseobacterium sp. TY3]
MKKTLLLGFGLIMFQQTNAQTILSEGFEGATFPPVGWTTFIGTNGLGTKQNWKLETTFVNTGSKAAYVQYENVTNGSLAEDWMVTNLVDLTTATAAELSFYTRKLNNNQTSNQSTYYIKVSTTSQTDHASFTTVQTWTEQQLVGVYNQYEKKSVDLSAFAGQKVYVAFVMTNDNANSWFVDDVLITNHSTEEVAQLPYSYGFESTDGWKIENTGKGNNWTIEETNSMYNASEGTQYARYRYDSVEKANAWYISKALHLTKDEPIKIEFDYRTGGFGGIEKLKVAVGKQKQAAALTDIVWDNNGETELTNTGWRTATATFTPSESGNHFVGFNAYSDANQMYLFIDNIRFSKETLAVGMAKKSKLSYFPNPINQQLTIKNNEEMQKLSIYSLDGSLISEKPINGTIAKIDMPNIKAGVYLGVITMKDGSKTSIKLIKK